MATPSAGAFANLLGKRALVTGASSGIGRAIALELACAGADVVVHFARSGSAADEVVQQVRAKGVRSQSCKCEYLQDDLQAFVDEAWSIWNGVDIWVNNAGADVLTGPHRTLSFAEKLEIIWKVDVVGTVHISREVAARMEAAGSGVVLNIGWDQADRGMEGDSAELFSASKNAIMGFSRSLAVSAAPSVRVNCIAPGWIQTAWGDSANREWQERVLRETPLKRWGLPEDIARLARFLVSDEAAYITGQVINANGGAVR